MMGAKISRWVVVPFVFATAGTLSCVGNQTQSTIEAINASAVGGKPFVEAVLEFPAPSSQFKSHEGFAVHVDARDLTKPAVISVLSETALSAQPIQTMVKAPAPADQNHRSPSSEQKKDEHPTAHAHSPDRHEQPGHTEIKKDVKSAPQAAHSPGATIAVTHETSAQSTPGLAAKDKLSSGAARERLSLLAKALEQSKDEFKGCLYPVRVRMVRSDGELVIKRGCRSESGWSRAVSDAINDFMVASRYGVPTLTDSQLKALEPKVMAPQAESREPASESSEKEKSKEMSKTGPLHVAH